MDKFPLTKKGFLRLEQELKNLKGIERPNVIAAIAEARSHGDLSENAEYSAAKEKQGTPPRGHPVKIRIMSEI